MLSRWVRNYHGGRGSGKKTSVEDAVSLVRNNDTLIMSGFVCQAIPETLMKALGERFLEEGSPRDLTFMFYGAGDPMGGRGTNHLKHPGLLKRIISSHYGQSPDLHSLITGNEVEAYALPMGAIARMIRSQGSGSPGYITRIGLGTFVDPRHGGGKLNTCTTTDLVELMEIDKMEYLRYKPLQINHAFIRATTADSCGNLTDEHESVRADIRVIATAARSSGGLVTAQVERMAATGSLNLRDVVVPGALVDCVVVAPDESQHMSFYTKYNPSWSGEVKAPAEGMPAMEMSVRKVIARRAALELKVDQIVNLGIGMPEGVALIAGEEGTLNNITLTTEAGIHGGLGASGLDFGPATNPSAKVEINQQFDFYNGGGLSICFLGAGECDEMGNINVSRLVDSKIIGPGGFIDITQSTRRVIFMGTFTKKGLQVDVDSRTKKLKIIKEGELPMFKSSVREVSFNAAQARLNGQLVKYVTERAVFVLSDHGLVLSEVAPGIDVQTQILDLMEFKPIIQVEDLNDIPLMDSRIFQNDKMGLKEEFEFSHERFHYDMGRNIAFIDFSNVTINDIADLDKLYSSVNAYMDEVTQSGSHKVHLVANYANLCLPEKPHIVQRVKSMFAEFTEKYYLSVRRLGGKAFRMQKYFTDASVLDNDELWDLYRDGKEVISRVDFRKKTREIYQITLNERDINHIFDSLSSVKTFSEFTQVMDNFLDHFELEHLKN